MNKCSIGNHYIAQLFNECLNKVNFNKINELKALLADNEFLLKAQNEVNNMEICDIESSLYFFRIKRQNDSYEDLNNWYSRIIGNRNINSKIIQYIDMLINKFNNSNIKCRDI